MDQAYPTQKSVFMARLETVKLLAHTEFDTYAVVKDTATNQHFLHYTLVHINLSEGGRRDVYEHFMPLTSDDVLALLFGEQPYCYPEHWTREFLRSGNDDRLIPFDPSENLDLEQAARDELALLERLARYKAEWNKSPDKEQLTRQLFHDLEKRQKEK